MSTKPPHLSELVARRLLARKMTHRELGEAIGVARPHVSNVVAGYATIPAWRVRKTAAALRVSVESLLAAIERTHDERGVVR